MDFVEETLIKKYKTAGDSVDLVEVLAFSLWKSATSVTILYGRSCLRLNIWAELLKAWLALTIG